MKTALCAAALGAAMLIGSGLPASSAPPGYIVTLEQVGSDVVATGGGAIDLMGLTFDTTENTASSITPSSPEILSGAPDITFDIYTGTLMGPINFGSGGTTFASSGTGNLVGVDLSADLSAPELGVPLGYVSDSALSDTATYAGSTFSSLGVTPGVYKWTWGTGTHQSFTLDIGTAVPEPSTWAMMALGFASLGLLGYRKTRRDNALA